MDLSILSVAQAEASSGFDVSQIPDKLINFALEYGPSVIAALVIFIVGRIVAKLLSKFVRRVCDKQNVDASVSSFVASLVYFVILVVTVLAALSKFGVQTTSFVAILGAAGFAVGMALQGSLGNFAAGVLILVLRPFTVGNYIIGADGAEGTVKEIGLFVTELATLDNIKVLAPNGSLFGAKIQVLDGYEKRRVVIPIGIGYDSDIAKARDVALEVMKGHSKTVADPAPDCVVGAWGPSSVDMSAVCWCSPADYWTVFFDLNRQLKEAYDKNGIEIPFPQRVVHMKKDAA